MNLSWKNPKVIIEIGIIQRRKEKVGGKYFQTSHKNEVGYSHLSRLGKGGTFHHMFSPFVDAHAVMRRSFDACHIK